MPDSKLIMLKEVLALKNVLFTRQKGEIGARRKDAWERLGDLAYRHKITKAFSSAEEFKSYKYRVWEDVFMVSCLKIN